MRNPAFTSLLYEVVLVDHQVCVVSMFVVGHLERTQLHLHRDSWAPSD